MSVGLKAQDLTHTSTRQEQKVVSGHCLRFLLEASVHLHQKRSENILFANMLPGISICVPFDKACASVLQS